MLYECRIAATPSGLVIIPTAKCVVTFIDKGGGRRLYLEDGDPHPLTIDNDTTMTIQRNGALYTWVRANDIDQEWGVDIRNIVASDLKDEEASGNSRYVLSAKERQQKR